MADGLSNAQVAALKDLLVKRQAQLKARGSDTDVSIAGHLLRSL